MVAPWQDPGSAPAEALGHRSAGLTKRIGWNWWNYAGDNTYRTGLMAGARVSPNVAVLRKWFHRSGRGATRRARDED